MTLDNTFQFLMSLIWALAVFGGIINLAALMTWVERKLSAMLQDRIGPNRANIRIFGWNFTVIGLIHIMVDPIKLFTKEDFIPDGANKVLHTIAPIICMIIPFVVFAVLPLAGDWHIQWRDFSAEELCLVTQLFPDGWYMKASDIWLIGPLFSEGTTLTAESFAPMHWLFKGDVLHLSDYHLKFVVADLDTGMLFVFAVAGLAVYGIILAGYSSNNKFSFLGAVRGANQMISYEVALGLTAVGIFMIYGSVSLSTIVEQQGGLLWGVIPKWGIVTQPLAFFLFVACGIAEIKRIPFDLPEGESEIVAGYFLEYSSTKFTMFMFSEFVEMIFLSAVIATLFFGGYQIPWVNAEMFQGWFIEYIYDSANLAGIVFVGLQAAKFAITLTAVLYTIFVIRWTFPRFRYDQIMHMGWKIVLPLALLNVIVTGVVLAFIRGWV